MKRWFLDYGWKFIVAFIVLGFLMAYLVRLEQKASGERAVSPLPGPRVTYAAVAATPPSARVSVPTSPRG